MFKDMLPKTGPFPLKGIGPVWDIAMALQQLWHCWHPVVLTYLVGWGGGASGVLGRPAAPSMDLPEGK